MNQNPAAGNRHDATIQVPRDRATDDKLAKKKMPAPDRVNIRDEDYSARNKPLVAGSREARALHDNPPPPKGELGVGTAGDAARATKGGIHDTTVPARQSLRRE